MKVGDKVRFEPSNAPRVMNKGASNTCEGIIVEIKEDTDFDPPETLVLVRYTKQTTWQRAHNERDGWYREEEL